MWNLASCGIAHSIGIEKISEYNAKRTQSNTGKTELSQIIRNLNKKTTKCQHRIKLIAGF